MLLCSIRHFWLRSSCIQEKSFTIQERWILSQHSDTIFRSPTCLASEIYTFVSCHYDVFCVFFHDIVLDSSFLTGFPLYTRKILHYTWKMNPFQHSDTIFRSSTSLASEIYTFVYCHYDVICVFFHVIVLDSSFLTAFELYTRKIFHYTWKMNPFQHSDTIFRSPTCLASEIYTFVSCHYDVFCVFFHDIVLDSSFLTGFPLYTRKILHYTWKMNPFPTFWHNFQISNMPSFWDIHVCILSLRCILCVFSWYCTRFVIFDWVPVVYKKNPSLYMKDESVPTFWHNFQIFNKPSFWDIYVCILSLRCNLCVFSCYCARFVIFDCVRVVYKKNPSLYKKDESFPNILTQFSDLQHA